MEKKLENGMVVTYADESKRLAADRWLVKLRCRVSIPLKDWMIDSLAGDDPQALFCREQFAGGLMHEIVRERNFIDAKEREEVLAGLIAQVDEMVMNYLGRENFVGQLFAVKLTECQQRFARQGWVESADEAELPEPADFSDCFR